METTSIPGRVQLSAAAAELLRRKMPPDLALEPRGNIIVKGKVRRRPVFGFVGVFVGSPIRDVLPS